MNTLFCLHKGTAQCAILQKNWYFCAENIEKDMKKVIICAVMALTMVCAAAGVYSRLTKLIVVLCHYASSSSDNWVKAISR